MQRDLFSGSDFVLNDLGWVTSAVEDADDVDGVPCGEVDDEPVFKTANPEGTTPGRRPDVYERVEPFSCLPQRSLAACLRALRMSSRTNSLALL